MAIPLNVNDLEKAKFVESSIAGQPAVVVTNADGSNIGSGSGVTPTAIDDGRTVVTTAGTRVPLAGSTAIKQVEVQALDTNTDKVVVGGANVVALAGTTRRGQLLSANDVAIFPIDNLNKIYIDAVVSGEGVRYTYVA